MAKQTVLMDDLDGSPAKETVVFAIDNDIWEIDLNEKNAAELRNSLEKFVLAARPAAEPVPAGRKRTVERDFDMSSLRAWAAKNNVKLPKRGRIAREIVERYKGEGGK